MWEVSAISRMSDDALCAGECGSKELMYEEIDAMASVRIASMVECMQPQIMWYWLSGSEHKGHGRGSGYLVSLPWTIFAPWYTQSYTSLVTRARCV